MNRRRFLALWLACLAACHRPPEPWRNTDLTGAAFGQDFDLTDHHGRRQKLANFRGQVVVVFFGYTACPDICPTTLSRLAKVMAILGKAAEKVQVLFITVDPERDSLEHLKTYIPWFHSSFLGLRGDAEQTRATTEAFRVFAARRDLGGGMGYVLDHTSGAYVYDPSGKLRLYVKDSASVDDIAADLKALLGN